MQQGPKFVVSTVICRNHLCGALRSCRQRRWAIFFYDMNCIYIKENAHGIPNQLTVCCWHRDLQKPSLRCLGLMPKTIPILWDTLSWGKQWVPALLCMQLDVSGMICRNHLCSAWATAIAMMASLIPKTIPILWNILSWSNECLHCTVVQLVVSSMICRNRRCDADPVTAAKKSQETIPLFTIHIVHCCARAFFSFLHLNYFGAVQIKCQLLKTQTCQERVPFLWDTLSIHENAKQGIHARFPPWFPNGLDTNQK